MTTQFNDEELATLFEELTTLGMPVEYENTGGGCEAIRWELPTDKQEILLTNLDQPSGFFVVGIYDIATGEQTDYFGEYPKEVLVRMLGIFANMGGN